MIKLFADELINKLLNSDTYKKYDKIYKDKNYVDPQLLKQLLLEHYDLYELFLKANIILYKYETKGLKKSFDDCYYHNGKRLFLEDVYNVLLYYYSHYSRCQTVLKKMIQLKLVPMSERKILKLILNRDISKELIPLNLTQL